jgi:hypothetical protein
MLPDPRCFAATTVNPLGRLSAQAVEAAESAMPASAVAWAARRDLGNVEDAYQEVYRRIVGSGS